MTKVFISCSEGESKAVAEILRNWLPKVIQAVQPWMSAEDLEKGTRWSPDLAQQLEQTKFGIICLTPDNLNAPWIHFEAGALSKTLEKTFVCPYLFRVTTADLVGPLAQFQATYANKDDTKKLLSSINKTIDTNRLPESELEETFAMRWPQLEDKLNHISKNNQHPNPKRSDRALLEEILELARAQSRRSGISAGRTIDLTKSQIPVGLRDLFETPEEMMRLLDEYRSIKQQNETEDLPFR